jgi:hypothetical protein
MKKKFSTMVLSLTVALLSSCNGNDIVEETAISNVKTKAIEQVKSRCSVVDGILHFSSTDDYYALTDSLCKLSDVEFENWENQNNFLSYRTYVNRIINEIESAQNENDVDKVSSLLKEYSKYVYLCDEEFVRPVIQALSYRSVVNKDGVFYFNDTRNVVDGQYVYANNQSAKQRSNPIKHEYVVYSAPLTKAIPTSTEINYTTIAYTKSDGTKRVYGAPKLIRNILSLDNVGNFTVQYEFYVNIDGKKKRPTGWKHYSTGYGIKDVVCRFKNIPLSYTNGTVKTGDITITHPEAEAIAEGKSGEFRMNVGISVPNYTGTPETVICLHFKVWTYGTAPEALGYNYYQGKYSGEDEANKKGNPSAKQLCPLHHLYNGTDSSLE